MKIGNSPPRGDTLPVAAVFFWALAAPLAFIYHATGSRPQDVRPLVKANGDALHISASVYGGKFKMLRRYRSLRA